MRRLIARLLPIAVIAVVSLTASGANAGVAGKVGRAVVRSLEKRAAKGAARSTGKLLYQKHRIDALHRPMVATDRDVAIRRYVMAGEARAARQSGVAPLTYVTPAKPGPPMGAPRAKAELGLRREPTAVIEGRLPKGSEISRGPVLGGSGIEMMSKSRLSRSSIRVRPLSPSRSTTPSRR